MFVSIVRMSELAALKIVMPKSRIIDSCPVDYWTVYADCGIQVSKLTPIQNKCFTYWLSSLLLHRKRNPLFKHTLRKQKVRFHFFFGIYTPSVVRARLSLKATAWARLSRAHGLSHSQAEPKPSWGLSLGLASAWATAFKGVSQICILTLVSVSISPREDGCSSRPGKIIAQGIFDALHCQNYVSFETTASFADTALRECLALDTGVRYFGLIRGKLYLMSASADVDALDAPSNSPHSLRRLEHLHAGVKAGSFWNKRPSQLGQKLYFIKYQWHP